LGSNSLPAGEGTILGILIGAAVMQVVRDDFVLPGGSACRLEAL
jgi:predicted ABC-type sugar transport system permease subunit